MEKVRELQFASSAFNHHFSKSDIAAVVQRPTRLVSGLDRYSEPMTAALGYAPDSQKWILVLYKETEPGVDWVWHAAPPTSAEISRYFAKRKRMG